MARKKKVDDDDENEKLIDSIKNATSSDEIDDEGDGDGDDVDVDEDEDNIEINDENPSAMDDADDDSVVMDEDEDDEDIDDSIYSSDIEDDYISKDLDSMKSKSIKFLSKKRQFVFKKKQEFITDPDKRISNPILSEYEVTRILSERANMLMNGSKPLINLSSYDKILSYEDIALEELRNDVCPMIVFRPIPSHINKFEKWSIGSREDQLQFVE